MEELRYIFSDLKVDVIFVSETWLNSDIPSSFVSIPGYHLFRNDRKGRAGGGVAIYVRECIRAKYLSSSVDQPTEFLCVEISSGNENEKCILSSVYCPPNCFDSDHVQEFENVLSHLTQRYANVIIGGDFNVDLLRQNNRAAQFSHLIQSLLLNVVNSYPTYFNSSNPSMLDLILVSDSHRVVSQDQVSPPSILDHDILFLNYDFALVSARCSDTVSFRDFNNLNMDSLSNECSLLPWNDIYNTPSVDHQVEILTSFVSHLLDKCVPIKTKRIRVRSCPWFSPEVQIQIAEREYLFQRYKRFKSEEARLLYRIARNKATAAIRRAKRQYTCAKLNTDLGPRALWRNLHLAGIHGKEKLSCPFDPDELNSAFTAVNGDPLDTTSGFPANLPDGSVREVSSGDHIDQFYFRNVNMDELLSAVGSIRSKAAGPDNLSPGFIKTLLPFIGDYILHIVNTCLMSSSFPISWKTATVLPIPKKAFAVSVSDFRPISILCFLSKVLEKIMSKQILAHVEGNVLLSRWQSGFRAFHSCETAVLKVSTDIREALDNDHFTALTLLDFSKAFDCVDHSLLIRKLHTSFNFSSSAAYMIACFLSDRSQRVKINGLVSGSLALSRGVPQGSILGPLLFSLFINDLPSVVRDVRIHLYADDVQVYLSRPIGLIEDCIERMNADLGRIYDWSIENRLLLNPGKSHCIMFYGNPLVLDSAPQIRLNGSPLPVLKKVSNLGIVLGQRMNCCDNVNSKISKIYAGLRRLWLSAYIIPRSTRLELVKALILPHFTFGSLVYPHLDSTCARRLEVAFNDCIRFIFGLRRFDHITPFRLSLVGCSLNTYLKRRALVFLFKLLKWNKPQYLREVFQFTTSQRNRNLLIPRFKSSVMNNSYPVQIIRLWNSLPHNIQTASTVNAFKSLLGDHFA